MPRIASRGSGEVPAEGLQLVQERRLVVLRLRPGLHGGDSAEQQRLQRVVGGLELLHEQRLGGETAEGSAIFAEWPVDYDPG